MFKSSIAIFTSNPEFMHKAKRLSESLNLPMASDSDEKYDYLLMLTPHYLGLQKTGSHANPLYIDFLSAKMQYRRQHASLRNEILARALGLKNKSPRKIVDATAGLARDSFILASLGFEVTLLERSPIIYLLIEDAIQRALLDEKTAPIVKRLQLIQGNASQWLPSLKPDIIYLDPMFPERKKSALSKQDMRIFHDIVGDDLDADSLFKVALTCATQRVVVKRPRLAKPLAGMTPTYSMEGSSNRFDIYLTRETHGNYSSTT